MTNIENGYELDVANERSTSLVTWVETSEGSKHYVPKFRRGMLTERERKEVENVSNKGADALESILDDVFDVFNAGNDSALMLIDHKVNGDKDFNKRHKIFSYEEAQKKAEAARVKAYDKLLDDKDFLPHLAESERMEMAAGFSLVTYHKRMDKMALECLVGMAEKRTFILKQKAILAQATVLANLQAVKDARKAARDSNQKMSPEIREVKHAVKVSQEALKAI